MSSTAAASGFVVFLLSVQVTVQSQDDWGVTYTSTGICAPTGSTVEMSCTYTNPSRSYLYIRVIKTFWFTQMNHSEPVDLTTDSEYKDRVQHSCSQRKCTLRISDLRKSDSAEYQFSFITNRPGWKYSGDPEVTMTVTDLHIRLQGLTQYNRLQCDSSCGPAYRSSVVWIKNGEKIRDMETFSYNGQLNSGDVISCALQGHEQFPSPSVYAPKLPSVSVSPSAEIVEGSSVNLTCSSDANSAANYTWTKKNGNLNLNPTSRETQLVLKSVRSSDSGEYFCTAENKLGSRTSEYIIDVKYAPRLPSVSVSPSAVILEGSSVTLTCSSDANPVANYTWYKENQTLLSEEPQLVFSSIQSSDSGEYHCAAENNLGRRMSEHIYVNVKYAPRLPSVSVSPSEIVEGSSVTLTCSSDANPAATYSWKKKNGNLNLNPTSRQKQLVLKSIRSSDSGEYFCTAENQLGSRTSEYIVIDVKYAPRLPSVSVSPSEIVEDSSVNLTCSSDANPAANFTWYKENQTLPQGPKNLYLFSSIRFKDSGMYHCKSENEYGEMNSTSVHVDVQYAPSYPFVLASPSKIVEGSSVTLTCNSHANPAANYTWYKQNEDSPKASGKIFTITDFRAEHSGNYFCVVRNSRGGRYSIFNLAIAIDKSAMKLNLIRFIPLVVLLIPLILLCLWMRKRKTLCSTNETVELDSCCLYKNRFVAAPKTEDTKEQEDLV